MLLAFTVGCVDPGPVPKWRIQRIAPNGTVERSWIVTSRARPEVRYSWGGKSGFDRSLDRHHEMTAPSGWLLDVHRIEP